jgi:hypothetical protein
MIKAWNRNEIVQLWNEGESAPHIVELLGLNITVRQVQRIGQAEGNRKLRHSGRLEKGEWGSSFKNIVRRLMIDRGDDPHLCALCGCRSEKPMTIHHTKYEGATLADLVFACMACQNKFENKGLA